MADPIRLGPDDYENAGEAYSRRSKVPIKFSKEGLGGDNGQFTTNLMANMLQKFGRRAGSITVDPNTPEGVPQTIAHEDVHALLNNLPTPQIPSGVLTAFSRSGRGGNPDVEIPAYMTAYDQKQVPEFTPEMRQSYMQGFLGNMMKSNPLLGQALARIAQR